MRLAPELASLVTPGVLWLDGLRIAEHDPRVDAALRAAEARVRVVPPTARSAVRRMYSWTGLDPTRTRPSSEALLRRVRRGEPLPRVNSLVDVCNWCSVELQLPFGLYDRDRIDGEVELRLGRPGEAYAGIRKDVVHVEGRLVVADRQGPFGNPTSDSSRTMITVLTARALVVVFSPREAGRTAVVQALDLTAARAAAFACARESRRLVIEGCDPLTSDHQSPTADH
jgi:DNA/RNA-binding domain of Phe-tRNA-synthetase-like protein